MSPIPTGSQVNSRHIDTTDTHRHQEVRTSSGQRSLGLWYLLWLTSCRRRASQPTTSTAPPSPQPRVSLFSHLLCGTARHADAFFAASDARSVWDFSPPHPRAVAESLNSWRERANVRTCRPATQQSPWESHHFATDLALHHGRRVSRQSVTNNRVTFVAFTVHRQPETLRWRVSDNGTVARLPDLIVAGRFNCDDLCLIVSDGVGCAGLCLVRMCQFVSFVSACV